MMRNVLARTNRTRKLQVASATVLAMCGVLWWGVSEGDDNHKVEVALINEGNWNQVIPEGKEVDAILGDLVLRNQYLVAVIAQPLQSRNANMTVRNVGGALIDLTTRTHPSDQLGAYYPGKRQYPFSRWNIVTGDRPVDLTKNITTSSEKVEVEVLSEAGEKTPEVRVRYILEPDEVFLTVTTRYSNKSQEPLKVALVDDLRIDGGKEYMDKSPNGESNLFWAHDRYWKQAYGVYGVDTVMSMNSDARTTTLKYLLEDNGEVTIPAGGSFAVTRWIIPGENVLDVKAAAIELRGEDLAEAELTLAGRLNPLAGAEVTFSTQNGVYGTGRTDAKGRLSILVPPGSYQVKAQLMGVTVLDGVTLELRAEAANKVRLESDFQAAKIAGKIVEEGTEIPIPCKVELKPLKETPLPDFGPESAEFAVKNLLYVPKGEFETEIPPGEYSVVVTHGPEFDAIAYPIVVRPGETAQITGKLKRSVQTPGWVSTDYHSHSSPSGDNTSSQLGRVLNLVAENIEFGPCTEHNRIDTYEKHIERLGVGAFLATCSGMELTGGPLPLNHQNSFPLKFHPGRQDGGGPQTDPDPAVQIARLAGWDNASEKLVQVNHPDMGWMFQDRDGNGEPDSGFNGMFPHINAIEIHPVHNILHLGPTAKYQDREYPNTVFAWLQQLNQGYRITGVVNTDAHYNYHGSGWLRNWVKSSTDDPAKIDVLEMVRHTREGKVIVSNGPYLELSVKETGGEKTVSAGEDLVARSKKVDVSIRVQTPNWLKVNRVFVLVNGRVDPKADYTLAKHPEKFQKGPLCFAETLTLELTEDSHVIVVAGGEGENLKGSYSNEDGSAEPAAFSNPVWVDLAGDGFTPNRDTLGHPLPVKFVSR